jgi:hypothetical protein
MRRSLCISPRPLSFPRLISILTRPKPEARSGSVQELYMILNSAIQVSDDRLINRGNIGDHWTDVARFHAFVGAHPHATAKQDSAVRDRFGHAQVLIVGRRIHAVRPTGLLRRVGLVGKLGVSKFVSQLAVSDLTVLDSHDQIIRRPSKVLAYGLSIICDCCDLHSCCSFMGGLGVVFSVQKIDDQPQAGHQC